MAARRLLIVMLVLLGLSTLAAALVPQGSLREEGTSTGTTTTQPLQTAPPVPATAAVPPPVKIKVGNGVPVVLAKRGQRFTLLVSSPFPTELDIPEFGLVGFAAPNAPARFELLTEAPGKFGVLFVPPVRAGKETVEVAARLEVTAPGKRKAKKQEKKRAAKSRARGGSG
jgi:hypothetical protein